MKFINKMERKVGRYAIPNLIRYIIGAYAIGLAMVYMAPQFLSYLTLEPYYIMRGQVWRLLTWIFIPESVSILTLIMLLFYYQIGSELEYYWGTFRFNLYMIGGIIFTDIAAMVLYGIMSYVYNSAVLMDGLFGTSYLNLSLFLAFAVCFPELEVRLYFLIPVKMKWMALVYGIITLYTIINASWVARVAIIASLLNFIIFYFTTKDFKRYSPKEVHRKKVYKAKTQEKPNQTHHKCAICGRTEKDDPTLQFRYCSKCEGNYEYCQDHLFTHQHVKRG